MTRSEKDKRILILLSVAVCAVLIFFVYLTAQSSKLQYEINNLNKQILNIERQISSTEVKIKTASNITNIEGKALALGLIYPTFDEIVYLNQGETKVTDLAIALKETAYR